MLETRSTSVKKGPFWLADAVLLGTAVVLVNVGARPMRTWEVLGVVGCVMWGAWLSILPYLRDHAASVKLSETDRLAETTVKLGQLEEVADRIAGATSQWQAVQERAHQTSEMAKGIVDRLTKDAEAFATAVARSADSDKQNLKLEVEKLRRGEGEWLQAVGRVMDHVFALHLAAVRSGQAGLMDQMEKFHGACRDALRRVGFNAVVAMPDEPFDPRKHQCADGSRPPEGTNVEETVAPGFAYQGQLLRPVIVRVAGMAPGAEAGAPALEGMGGEAVNEGEGEESGAMGSA